MVVESGEFSPNTARLTACRARNIVADSQTRRLNFLFAGADKPDLRVPLKLTELTDAMRDVEFKVFRDAACAPEGPMDCCRSSKRLGGDDVKVIVRSGFEEMKASPWERLRHCAYPGGGTLSRKEIDDYTNRRQIISLVAALKKPAVYFITTFVEDGGLVAYAVNPPNLARRIAGYADKILRGAKPGDLPIEQPTRIELSVNMKTAKALGITIPNSILVRADKVIE